MLAMGFPYQGRVTDGKLQTASGELTVTTPTVFTTLMERPSSAQDYSTGYDSERGYVWNQRFLLDRGRFPDFHWVYIDADDVTWLMYATFSTSGTVATGNTLYGYINVYLACRFGEFEDRNADDFDSSKVSNNINYSIDHYIGQTIMSFTAVDLQTGFSSPADNKQFSPHPNGSRVLISWGGDADPMSHSGTYYDPLIDKTISGIGYISLSGAFNVDTLSGITLGSTVTKDCDVAIPTTTADASTGNQYFQACHHVGAFYDEYGNENYIEFKSLETNPLWSGREGYEELRTAAELGLGSGETRDERLGIVEINGDEVMRLKGVYDVVWTGSTWVGQSYGDLNGYTYTLPDDTYSYPSTWSFTVSLESINMVSDRIIKWAAKANTLSGLSPSPCYSYGWATASNSSIYQGKSNTSMPAYIAYNPRNQSLETGSVEFGFV